MAPRMHAIAPSSHSTRHGSRTSSKDHAKKKTPPLLTHAIAGAAGAAVVLCSTYTSKNDPHSTHTHRQHTCAAVQA